MVEEEEVEEDVEGVVDKKGVDGGIPWRSSDGKRHRDRFLLLRLLWAKEEVGGGEERLAENGLLGNSREGNEGVLVVVEGIIVKARLCCVL